MRDPLNKSRHDEFNALQAEKDGTQSKLAQCLVDKATLGESRDELEAAKAQLAAELAATDSKVQFEECLQSRSVWAIVLLSADLQHCLSATVVTGWQQVISGRQEHAGDLQPAWCC